MFSINMTSKLEKYELSIVNSPYILTSKLLLSELTMWSMYESSISRSAFFSWVCKVFMMNFLSCEKKKKLPLFPWDSPAWKTLFRFLATERDSWMVSKDISSRSRSTWNFSMQWEITFDLIFSLTGFERVVCEEPRCSLKGFCCTRVRRFWRLCFLMFMISLMDYSAKFGFRG